MATVIPMPVITKSGIARALANSTLSQESVVLKTGMERTGRRLLAYADFEDPPNSGEVVRLYLED